MYRALIEIKRKNTFHARLIIMLLYLEKNAWVKLPYKVLRKIIIQMIYNCEIHPDSFSNQSLLTLRLPHPYNVIIHRECQLDINCTIFQEVTIGVIEKEGGFRAPRIESDVYVGNKSSILGDVLIESGTKIGAHTLVLKSTKRNSTVFGLYK